MIAFENLSSTAWLKSYRSSKGITYPMVLDSLGQVFSPYRVDPCTGTSCRHASLWTRRGIVRFGATISSNMVLVLSDKITELLSEPP